MEALASILKQSKIERRVGIMLNLQRNILNQNLAHPKLKEIFER